MDREQLLITLKNNVSVEVRLEPYEKGDRSKLVEFAIDYLDAMRLLAAKHHFLTDADDIQHFFLEDGRVSFYSLED